MRLWIGFLFVTEAIIKQDKKWFLFFLGFARDKKSFFRRPFFVVAVAMATAVFDVSHNAIKKITIIWFLACIKDYQSTHGA